MSLFCRIGIHDWFYYKVEEKSRRRCNKCGRKQYWWACWMETGWDNCKNEPSPPMRKMLTKLTNHIEFLQKEKEIMEGQRHDKEV